MKLAVNLALIGCLFLAGCNHLPKPNLTHTVNVLVPIPEALYECPTVVTLPEWSTLKDSEVAALLNELWQNNQTCANNMRAIHASQDQAASTLQDKDKK